MKAHEKKKLFKRMCKKNVKAGLINLPTGQWGSGQDNAMKRDTIGGQRSESAEQRTPSNARKRAKREKKGGGHAAE